jgi:hypothetical protein
MLSSIVSTALAQKSVHWTESDFYDLIGPSKRVADVTADFGVERRTLPSGKTAEILLVNQTVYVRGNNVAIDELGLTPHGATSGRIYFIGSSKQAHRYAGRWISIPQGDKDYSAFADDLTLASIVHDATPPGSLKATSRRAPLLDVQGTTSGLSAEPGTYELKARVSGDPLPVAFAYQSGTVDFVRSTFSKWNERMQVTAPKHAVPIATVRKS